MRKRVEGNASILEDENGREISVSHIYGNTIVVRHGDWVMIKEMAAYPCDAISGISPSDISGRRFRFYGISLEIRSNIPRILGDFVRIYGRFIREEPGQADMTITALATDLESPRGYAMLMQATPDKQFYLKGDFCQVSYLSSLEHLLFQVHQESEVFLLTNNPAYTFIHGGTVERDGIGYIMPAESRQGKTTLTMALVAAGYGFMSDEFAVLDPDGTLLPFPRTLSVRGDTMHLFPELDRRRAEFPVIYSPVDDLYSIDPISAFSTEPGAPCPVRYVIFPQYDPSGEPAMRAISGMEAIRRLVGTRSFISLGLADKQVALDFMISLLAKAECYDLTTGDLKKTVQLVGRLGA